MLIYNLLILIYFCGKSNATNFLGLEDLLEYFYDEDDDSSEEIKIPTKTFNVTCENCNVIINNNNSNNSKLDSTTTPVENLKATSTMNLVKNTDTSPKYFTIMFNGSKISSTTENNNNNIATLSGADQQIENSSSRAMPSTATAVNKRSTIVVTDASIEPLSDKSMILNESVTANNAPSL